MADPVFQNPTAETDPSKYGSNVEMLLYEIFHYAYNNGFGGGGLAGSFTADVDSGAFDLTINDGSFIHWGTDEDISSYFDGTSTLIVEHNTTGSGTRSILSIQGESTDNVVAFEVKNLAATSTVNSTALRFHQMTSTQSRVVYQLEGSWGVTTDASRTSNIALRGADSGTFDDIITLDGWQVRFNDYGTGTYEVANYQYAAFFLSTGEVVEVPKDKVTDDSICGLIASPDNKDYRVRQNSKFGGSINRFTVITTSGTCDVDLEVNGTPVGSTASASTTEDIQTTSFPVTIVPGDDIDLVVSNNSGAVDLAFNIDFEIE